MTNKQGIIFDMDGTLLDSMHVWINLADDMLKKLGITPKEQIYDIASVMSLKEAAEYFIDLYNIPKSVDEVLDMIHKHIEDFYFNKVQTKENAKEVLTYFSEKGVPMSVATLTNKHYTVGALKHCEIFDFFHPILTCGEIGHYKTEPNIFYECAKIMKTEPENTFVIEDSLYAIKTAKKYGFITVGIADKNAEKDREKIKKEADFFIENLTELKDVIK
ncbi:MAG: HAD family phosphatase [Clostridia bacterium]|nr:HAD family phosphatase [Clostridia bacterium]